ncbi:MAG: putative bifunctional diguanylate cyclase/phosphodiesterase [Gammaproteobacteria bacterium]
MTSEHIKPRKTASIRRIDFGKYTGVLKKLLGDALSIVICDCAGRRVWSLSRGEQDVYKQALQKLNDSVPDWPHTGAAIRRCTIDDERSAYLTSLQGDDGTVSGGLMVLVSHRQDTGNTAFARISEGMNIVSRLLGDEALMLDELGAVTHELTRRYEELNLIYNTQDSVKYFDEGQDAIRNLVRNTCEYTGFAFSALIMADQNTVHSFSSSTRPLPSADALREVIRADLYEHVAFRKEVLVHNGGKRYHHLLAGIPCKLLACPIFDENNEVIGVLVLANEGGASPLVSSDRKLLQVMAHKASRIIQANYDALTGMMTRNGFEYHLETGLYVVRYKQVEHTVLNINVDRLHVVNDTCGHHAGDALIRRVAAAIRNTLSADDVVARLGGGEFGVLLVEREDIDADDVAEQIRSAVREVEFSWDNRRFQVSVSIGLAPMEANTESIVTVMSAAEVACAAAKDLGRDRVQIYQIDNTMLVRRKAQIHWLGHLHSALREDKFELFCQPIKRVGEHEAHHAEILLRLNDEHQGLLSPDVFLGSAERYNLMPAIDRWVIRNTMKMLVSNLPKSLLREQVWAINLSGQTLSDANFMQFILDETKRAGIRPQNLCFEVTETAAVANIKEAGQFIAELRKHGYAFSLDDFGSGLSSFAYLKALPVDYLKIDGSIAKEVVADPVSASMVGAICQVARDMQLETIAEFVENEQLEIKLASLGVSYVQGYNIGKPQPLSDALRDLTDRMIMAAGEDTCTVPAIDETGSSVTPLRANL